MIREEEGKGGHMIQISKSVLLDCFKNFRNGTCILSYANSPKNCISKTTISKVLSNCVIISCPRQKTAALKSTKTIREHEEILICYHSSYKFPEPEF
jgi:hypothetical protein